MKERIGLIGVGNMGTAILEGIFKKKIASPRQVWVYDKFTQKAAQFSRKWGVRRSASVAALVNAADVVLLAVKPQDLAAAGNELASAKRGLVLISILAGTPIKKIQRFLGKKFRIVRAMPNLGAKVGESVTALTGTDSRALKLAENIFSGCGQTIRLAEKHFDLVTALSGSGPAYFFLLMEQLANFGMKKGLSQKNAEALAVQTAVGAALLARTSQISPASLRQMVTSKKGTTEAALQVLASKHLPEIFSKAFTAALKRGRALSRG